MADDEPMQEVTRWLALIHAPQTGPQALLGLLQHFDTVEALFTAPAAHLRKLGVPDPLRQWIAAPDTTLLQADLDWLAQPGHHLVPYTDTAYPALLKQIQDPPLALFVAGDPAVLNWPALAIVGARNPTPDGRDNAHAFAAHLARQGLAIVSGLAIGIDAAAHRGALDAGGITIAVCGTGLDQVYPARNRDLAGAIREQGALVSEFPAGTPARPANFPQRNRIISALASGTLVVEATMRSGSLITARLASEQGREVFALPGSIHNPMAKGCHHLLRQGAKLVDSAGHILEELGQFAPAPQTNETAEPAGENPSNALDPEYEKLLECMGDAPASIDKLVERSGLTPGEVSSMLLIMELRGLVESTPGGRYARLHKRP